VGCTAGLDGHGKSRAHRDSIPGPSSLSSVPIPTELCRPYCDAILKLIILQVLESDMIMHSLQSKMKVLCVYLS
jgi:hypothetical protein